MLRSGVREYHAAYDFGISETTASRYFVTWLSVLNERLPKIFFRLTSDQIKKTTPVKFQQLYPGQDVKEIWDGTELEMQIPTCPHGQYYTFSDYKKRNTVKFLVGIAPGGFVTFLSPAYPGRISDIDIVNACGILSLLEAGDYIMADKGFLIRALLNRIGCDLIMPPKKRRGKEFNQHDTSNTRKVANLRIHVERFMQLIKQFRILQRVIPIKMVDLSTQIFRVCGYLTLQWKPLVGVDFGDQN